MIARGVSSLTREDPSAFSPPPAFGPFRVLHQVGIGTLGPVFRTYEPTRDRLIAVKVFRLDIVPEQAQTLALALNRATESSLFHPSIVGPVASGMEGTLAYRAEEYVAAESLDVAMRHYAPAPLEKALPFLTQLAGAIDFARAAGIGHGGLHPRDIFVTPDEARATGFGVVEALEEVGIRAPVRRPYAAPERIAGRPWSTPADVFSLAVIAFELLTGRRPAGIGAQIGSLPDGQHSAVIHSVLARAMDEDPSERFPSALAFAAALDAAGRGESTTGSTAAMTAPAAAAVVIEREPEPKAEPDPEPAPMIQPEPPRGPEIAPEATPGEFAIEKDVDPILAAIDDDIAAERALDEADHAERTLFDEPPAGHLDAEDIAAERFADEFVEEQEAEAESRRPLEALHETIVPVAAEAPMFSALDREPEHEIHEPAETSRPALLPLALVAIVSRLIGFGAGDFIGSRGRLGADTAGTPATASGSAPAASASGPATPNTPGQYSEQKVTPPAPVTRPPSPAPPSAAPPVPDETPAARTPAAGPAGRGTGPAAAAPVRGRLVVKSTPSRG